MQTSVSAHAGARGVACVSQRRESEGEKTRPRGPGLPAVPPGLQSEVRAPAHSGRGLTEATHVPRVPAAVMTLAVAF